MKVSPWLRYHTDVHRTLTEALAAVKARNPRSAYLCGGINGLSDSACKDWRQAAREALHAFNPGLIVHDPMARDYRGREDECVNEIVEGDKRDIIDSDVLLVNASKPSWGTAMEIMFAWLLRRPVIAFVEVA